MAKRITLEQAFELVTDGCSIITGLATAEAQDFMNNVHTIANRVRDVSITNCIPMSSCRFLAQEYSSSFNVNSMFYSAQLRAAHVNGNVSFIPNHLHLSGIKRVFYEKSLQRAEPLIFVGVATPPDKHGYVSLSVSCTNEKHFIAAADIVILEINPNYPRTFGDVEIHESAVDYFVEADYPVPVLPDVPVSERDEKIGKLIADYINDGDCLQLGIGGIPNAVADALASKKDLGIHTEMLTSGLVKLAKAGIVNNSRKTLHVNKMVATFALGTKEVYDYIDDNPSVLILDGNYVNDPAVIGLNDNQVSINTTIEIDLVGQCCSETIGARQFSGTGGQADTAIGAQKSKNGRSFIALYSTADVRSADGERTRISKIVPTLKPGAVVSLSRNDVDFVVTEYGVASLRGTDIKERVRRLIAIAHPDYRDELIAGAKNLMFI
jgi:acyl-CoA hydrolase